jgi:hypothetical protein
MPGVRALWEPLVPVTAITIPRASTNGVQRVADRLWFVPMPTTSTERCRKHRARRRAGLERFTIELPIAALGETLVAARWLEEADLADYRRLHAALEQALREWCGVSSE